MEGNKTKKKYKVVYERSGCIEILSCVSEYPKRWIVDENNPNDNKAWLVGAKKKSDDPEIWELEFDEDELAKFKASANVCPARVIHIIDIETGKRLV